MRKKRKTDLRVIKTKQKLANTLLEMMTSESIDNIKISSLCTHAGVSRATFYNNFNVIYDVLNYHFENTKNELFNTYMNLFSREHILFEDATKYIAQACKEIDATMMYISTDYVFDGKGDKFFETDDLKNGLSVYGKSKSEGEEYVKSILNKFFIVRISWVFGINGNNFVKTMIRLSESKKDKITVVDDQIGSPTYTKDLSVLIAQMIQTEKYGIYHATNEGVCSFFAFASQIMKMIKSKTEVVKISSEEYRKLVPNQAERPLNSRLSKKSLVDNGFSLLPDWKDALKRYIYDELKYIKE